MGRVLWSVARANATPAGRATTARGPIVHRDATVMDNASVQIHDGASEWAVRVCRGMLKLSVVWNNDKKRLNFNFIISVS